MSNKKTSGDRGAAISAARQAASRHHSEQAQRRLAERKRGADGRLLAKLSPEDWDDVIDLVLAGESDANIMRRYDLSTGSIVAKRHADPDFAARYNEAVAESFVQIARDIQNVTRGVAGYSSGDVRRDELIAKYDLELAKRFARAVLGDRMAVDATHSIAPVVLPAIALPAIDEGRFTEVDDTQASDDDQKDN